MMITKPLEFKQALRAGPYAWPGGYPTFFLCEDGGTLCYGCAHHEAKLILQSIRDFGHGAYQQDWCVVAHTVNYEDTDLYCDHCNKRIEAAYE